MKLTNSPPRLRGPRVGRLAARLLSFLGCALTLQSTPAAAQARRPVPPSRAARVAAPPWSEARGSISAPLASARVSPLPLRPADHPAIHPGGNSSIPHRLFPRETELRTERKLRTDAKARHPAGKAAAPQVSGDERDRHAARADAAATTRRSSSETLARWTRHERDAVDRHSPAAAGASYRVRLGDSLWSIASGAAEGAGDETIRGLTKQIYRLNRAVVGPDPDLILPGQILRLPREIER